MSQFIVPIGSLPTIQSIEAKGSIGQRVQSRAGSDIPFANFLQQAMQDVTQTAETSRAGMYNLAVGATDDLHTGAVNSLKSSTAVSYAAGVTSAVIRAYNELMRMQL